MNKIKISARVGMVYAPKKIGVFINNNDNDKYDIYFETQRSFEQQFDAAPGTYTINVVGMNQAGDSTKVSVGGDFEQHDTKESSDGNYILVFIGRVN